MGDVMCSSCVSQLCGASCWTANPISRSLMSDESVDQITAGPALVYSHLELLGGKQML